MLKKLFKAVAEQPHRYITMAGSVHEKKFHERFMHRAEFKAIAAMTVGVMFFRSVFNNVAPGWGDEATIIASTTAGYVLGRNISSGSDDSLFAMRYGRNAIVDTQPDKGQMTDPDDLQRTMRWKKLSFNPGLIAVHTFQAYMGLGHYAELAMTRVQNEYGLYMLAPHAFAFGLFTERIANVIANHNRGERVLKGEYVILKEPPEKQTAKSYDEVRIGLGIGKPAMPEPSGA